VKGEGAGQTHQNELIFGPFHQGKGQYSTIFGQKTINSLKK
jgi:hypothetical protein